MREQGREEIRNRGREGRREGRSKEVREEGLG